MSIDSLASPARKPDPGKSGEMPLPGSSLLKSIAVNLYDTDFLNVHLYHRSNSGTRENSTCCLSADCHESALLAVPLAEEIDKDPQESVPEDKVGRQDSPSGIGFSQQQQQGEYQEILCAVVKNHGMTKAPGASGNCTPHQTVVTLPTICPAMKLPIRP